MCSILCRRRLETLHEVGQTLNIESTSLYIYVLYTFVAHDPTLSICSSLVINFYFLFSYLFHTFLIYMPHLLVYFVFAYIIVWHSILLFQLLCTPPVQRNAYLGAVQFENTFFIFYLMTNIKNHPDYI